MKYSMDWSEFLDDETPSWNTHRQQHTQSKGQQASQYTWGPPVQSNTSQMPANSFPGMIQPCSTHAPSFGAVAAPVQQPQTWQPSSQAMQGRQEQPSHAPFMPSGCGQGQWVGQSVSAASHQNGPGHAGVSGAGYNIAISSSAIQLQAQCLLQRKWQQPPTRAMCQPEPMHAAQPDNANSLHGQYSTQVMEPGSFTPSVLTQTAPRGHKQHQHRYQHQHQQQPWGMHTQTAGDAAGITAQSYPASQTPKVDPAKLKQSKLPFVPVSKQPGKALAAPKPPKQPKLQHMQHQLLQTQSGDAAAVGGAYSAASYSAASGPAHKSRASGADRVQAKFAENCKAGKVLAAVAKDKDKEKFGKQAAKLRAQLAELAEDPAITLGHGKVGRQVSVPLFLNIGLALTVGSLPHHYANHDSHYAPIEHCSSCIVICVGSPWDGSSASDAAGNQLQRCCVFECFVFRVHRANRSHCSRPR